MRENGSRGGMPEADLLAELEAALPAASPWRGRVDWVAEVRSTNDAVLTRLGAGEAPWFAVFAEHQTAGRGQRGRRWVGRSGRSLLFSAAVPGPARLDERGPAAVVVGGVLARLASTFGLEAQLKLPNDLLLGGAKAAGVLVEARSDSSALCVGIGLNVLQRPEDFPPDLGQPATSLACHVRQLPSRPVLAAMLLEELAEVFGSD